MGLFAKLNQLVSKAFLWIHRALVKNGLVREIDNIINDKLYYQKFNTHYKHQLNRQLKSILNKRRIGRGFKKF